MADNPIKYSDLVQPDGSIENAIKQLEELQQIYTSTQDAIAKSAIKIKASIVGVSSATEQGRKATAAAATEAGELAKAQAELEKASSEAARQLAMLREELREQKKLNQLAAKEANAARGSYDQLSAAYSRNKMILNKYSQEMIDADENLKQMQEDSRKMYEEMNKLQKATGKYTLQVGNYAIAGKEMRQEMREIIRTMSAMGLQGKTSSKEYQELATRLGELRNAIGDVNTAATHLADDNPLTSAALGFGTAVTGAFSALSGAMALFGADSEEVAEAQKKLQAAIALVNGAQAIQNALNKDSALLWGVKSIQMKAAAAAATLEGNATGFAAIKQAAFNAVAKANPYVALAVAITTVVGALWAFSRGSEDAAEAQKKVNENLAEARKAWGDYYAFLNQKFDARQTALQIEIKHLQDSGAATDAIRSKEDELMRVREESIRTQRKQSEAQLLHQKENAAELEKELKNYAQLQSLYYADRSKEQQAEIDASKAKITRLQLEVKAAEDVLAAEAKLNADRTVMMDKRAAEDKKRQEDAAKAAEDAAKAAAEAVKKAIENEEKYSKQLRDLRIASIKDVYAKEIAETKAANADKIAELRKTLREDEHLTIQARISINAQIVLLERQQTERLVEIEKDRARRLQEIQREIEDMRISAMDEGVTKEIASIQSTYKREIEDAKSRLSELQQLSPSAITAAEIEQQNQRILTATAQRDAALVAAMHSYAEQQKSITEKAIADELAKFDELQEYEKSVFDLRRTTAEQAKDFEIQQAKARIDKLLELDDQYMTLSQQQRETLLNQKAAYWKQEEELAKKAQEKIKAGVGDAYKYSASQVKEYLSSVITLKEAQKSAADEAVNDAKTRLQAEMDARNAGYANDVEIAQKELENAKKRQAEAEKQARKAQRVQAAIQALEQAGNLVTGTTKIWAQLGFPAAIPATAVMWSTFAASKIMAANATKYGDGGVELLQGGSHQSGNDIDFGRDSQGRQRKAEGGEFFAVINKRNSRKYRQLVPEIINSLNRGNFEKQFLANGDLHIGVTNRLDTKSLEKQVADIKHQLSQRQFFDGNGNLVIRDGNNTRIIKRR